MHARDRWDARYADRPDIGPPAAFVRNVAEHLPARITAVDLAGGTGRNALWLAELGHAVTLVDISSVALGAAADAAALAGVPLEFVERDLEADGLPPGRRWDLALMHYFFDAAVVRAAWDVVQPGGVLAIAQPTVVNLERHEHPRRRFLLEIGQLAALTEELVAIGPLEVLECTEGWRESSGHEGRLVVRRPL